MPSLFDAEPTASADAPYITAHCDGGARGNPGPAGFGAVIQDASGHVLAELSEFLGFKTNNFAEYSGLLGVLDWALKNNQRNVRVISDSELMVKQIQGKYKVNSPDLRPLWEEARRRITKLDSFQISHALRHKNKTADRLANEAMDRGMGKGKPASAPAISSTPAPTPAATPYPSAKPAPQVPASQTPAGQMLRGYTKNGTIHLLGGATLPDGIFVKIVPE